MKHHSSKVLSIILTVAMLLGVCVFAASASENNLPVITGSGTVDDPYQIASAEQVEYLRLYPSSHFIVVNDIAFGQLTPFTPIDNFTGTLNGNNYTFYYLTIDETSASTDYTGFFRTLGAGAHVYDLHMKYASVRGKHNVGGLAGVISGAAVEQVYFEGGTIVESTSYQYAVGAICAVANNGAVISNCMAESGTHVAGDIVGGLAGVNQAALWSNCFFMGVPHAIQGPYSTIGAIFGKQMVNSAYAPAQNVYWDVNYSGVANAVGQVETTDAFSYTGTEGLVGVVTPTAATTVVAAGSSAQLSVAAIPAGATVIGTWQNPSYTISLTSDGVVTGLQQGTGYGNFVMPCYGGKTASFPFTVTVQ